MSQSAIRIENLCKCYKLGAQVGPSLNLRETLAGLATGPLRRLRDWGKPPAAPSSFWALRDVSFDVAQGDVVGLIGRNGAGKSTLLKILSQITEPTSGRVVLEGRVASLLEVGTGFHGELTGRENIFLNGAILGMRRAEIRAKFDEIVAFSEVDRFLDTPVKRYSSGMYMRLAFAIAAHLDPEILVIDEVLAVGDASFQKKCLGRIGEVARGGRTVLFVSHDLQAVSRLCQRGVLLADGRVTACGAIGDVVHAYMSTGEHGPAQRTWPSARAPGNETARLVSARVRTTDGETAPRVDIRRPVGVEMEYDVLQDGRVLVPNFHFFNSEGVCAFIALGWQAAQSPRRPGRYRSTAWIPGNTLAEGMLSVGVSLSTLDPVTVHFWAPDALAFDVVDSMDGDSARGPFGGPYAGVVRPIFDWDTELVAGERAAA